jgi:hypothetical protein
MVTTEIIDWATGRDPICRTVIPVDDVEWANLIAVVLPDTDLIESVGRGRQSLTYDRWYKDLQPVVCWSTGVYVGDHD